MTEASPIFDQLTSSPQEDAMTDTDPVQLTDAQAAMAAAAMVSSTAATPGGRPSPLTRLPSRNSAADRKPIT